jgi:NAD(P)-dependent dehydrogenase (short-subunit alcohol dehydrogenase family)
MTRIQQQAMLAGAAVLGGILATRGLRARRRISFRGRSVVITGGSRGLGLLMALCARDHDELVRARHDLLERAPDADVTIESCDVGNSDQASWLIRSVVERTGSIDVLINNAGIITVGPVEHMRVGDFAEAMGVHFWGPLHTMLAAVPFMRTRRFGRIVNISSIGGKVAVPHLAPYCASKFALTGLSDSLRTELAHDGIQVTTVCPGLMRTGSPFNAWFRGRHREEFTWFAISDSLPIASIDADRASRQVVDACRHGDAELVITWPARLAIIANAVAPEIFASAMTIANRLLPRASGGDGDAAHSGWQSLSDWAPSKLTRMTERAAVRNNEIPAGHRG